MARRKKNKIESIKNKTAQLLVGILLASLLAAALIAIPGFEENLYKLLGITPSGLVPVMELQSPTGVHFIDIGQGDAVLLEESGEFALIDAGLPEGKDTLLAYLREAGVQSLKYVVMTHPHADHIGGMTAVVSAFPVEKVLMPDFEKAPYPTTSLFLGLLTRIEERGLAVQTMVQGEVYPLGTGTIRVVHDGVWTADNYNLISTGLLFEAGGLRYLSTGDAEKPNEAVMLEEAENLPANLFKAGHHGSSTSNTLPFLQAVSPQIVVISCATGNSYGHPHREPLKVFQEVGAQVLRTDRNGSVLVRPDQQGNLVAATSKEAA